MVGLSFHEFNRFCINVRITEQDDYKNAVQDYYEKLS